MKREICVTIIISCIITSINCVNRKSLASRAIEGMINEYYPKNEWRIDVVSIGSETDKAEELIARISRNKTPSAVLKVSAGGLDNRWIRLLNTSSIVNFGSPKLFKEVSRNITWQRNDRKRHKHLVCIPTATVSDLENLQLRFPADSVDFLVNETDESIDLVSAFMFTPKACRRNEFKTINRFKRSTERWESSIFYPKKYQNFHGCRLTVSRQLEKNTLVGKISETLARFHNFTTAFKVSTFDLEIIKDDELDLLEKTTMHNVSNGVRAISSVTVFVDNLNFICCLYQLFDNEVWIALIATLLLAMISIQLMNLISKKIYILVCGREINHPTINLVSTFLTGTQDKTPAKSFARFLLMLFIIWSLIFRTCHQSMLYSYLQADLRKPTLQSIDEILENDLNLYGSGSTENSLFLQSRYTG